MTVKFQLSRDEFSEVYRNFRPAPDFAVLVVRILIAVAVVIVAIFVGSAYDGYSAEAPAWILLMVGLVLLGTAIWEPTIGTLIRKWQFSRRVRSAYQDHFAGKEKEFTFDEEKWSNGIQTGPRELLWSDLNIASQLKNVISLESEAGFTIVPKRVLTPEQLSALRRLIFGEFVAPIAFSAGLRDYFDIEIRSLWQRRKGRMVSAHATGFLLAAIMAWTSWSIRGQNNAVWLGIMACIMLFITIATQCLYVFTAYLGYWRQTRISWQAEFLDRGAHVRTATTEHFNSWPLFTKFRETAPAFLLYVEYFESDRYYILPKIGLTPERQEALRQQLSSKLQPA